VKARVIALAWMLSQPIALMGEAATPATTSISTPTTPTTTATPSTEPARQEQIRKWMRYLTEENTLTTRKTACADMLASGWPEAVVALVDALNRGADPIARLAICETIAAQTAPPAAFVQPLRLLLDNSDTRLREAAASALGAYRDAGVIAALAQDVADPSAPISRRIAAVRALTYAHDVVKAIDVLITSLGDPDKRIRAEVLAALPRLAPVDFGPDATAWRHWWKNDRAELLDGLSAKLRQQERQQEAIEARYVELLAALFAKTPDEQRDAQLLEWFKSTFAIERRAAVILVHERLRDGKLPSAAVAAAIRKMIDDPAPRIRREVVLLIRDLREPEDAPLLLTRLEQERDRIVTPAIYSALGRLGSATAMPVCIAGLNDANEDILAEAVTALGWLVQQNRDAGEVDVTPAIEATRKRFGTLPSAPDLRERVVDAMAKMKDAQFAPVLRKEAGEDESSAAVRVAAVRGLGLLGDAASIDVVAARLSDKDAGVREAAVNAMAALGTTPSQLDPAAEPVKTIQALVWEAYRTIFARLSTAEELAVLKEFNAKPDPVAAERYVQLVTSIEQKLAAMNPSPPELPAIRIELGDALARINRGGDAAAAYEKALPLMAAASPEKRTEVYLKMLRAFLRAGLADKAIASISGKTPVAIKPEADVVAQIFTEHLESLIAANKPDAAIELLDKLQPAADPPLGLGRSTRLKALRQEALQLQRAKDRENVQKWVADLKSGGEAAANASVMIRQLGTRAIGPLKNEIKKLLTGSPKDHALEHILVDLLKQLVPDWSGYNPDAKIDEKLKALQSLPEAV
jgi:HEAT repeat protein